MSSRGPLWHRGIVFAFILCLRLVSPLLDGVLFEKMELPSDIVTNCPLTVVSHPPGSELSSTYYCSLQCLTKLTCTSYCISGSSADPEGAKCNLLNAVAVPMGSRALQTRNGSCFVSFRSPWPRGIDLARGKPVTVAGTWDKYYVNEDTVVSGSRCEVSKHSCFCSALRVVSASAFTVDLGASLPVSTVVVTVSSYFPEYFDDVEIRVGDADDSSDRIFITYSGPPNSGEVLVFRGDSTLIGRYVSIYRTDISLSLCLCLVQVYSV